MLHITVMTLALLSSGCPNCQQPRLDLKPGGQVSRLGCGAGANTIHHATALGYALPRRMVGCAGQNCFSCNRPLLPGMPGYDYRRDFNYPWSQTPCVLPPPAYVAAPVASPFEDEPEASPPERIESARRRTKPLRQPVQSTTYYARQRGPAVE